MVQWLRHQRVAGIRRDADCRPPTGWTETKKLRVGDVFQQGTCWERWAAWLRRGAQSHHQAERKDHKRHKKKPSINPKELTNKLLSIFRAAFNLPESRREHQGQDGEPKNRIRDMLQKHPWSKALLRPKNHISQNSHPHANLKELADKCPPILIGCLQKMDKNRWDQDSAEKQIPRQHGWLPATAPSRIPGNARAFIPLILVPGSVLTFINFRCYVRTTGYTGYNTSIPR